MATNKQLAELMGTLNTTGKTNAEIVIDAYETLFNRLPDTDGQAYWTDRLDNGLDSADLTAALLGGIRQYEGEFSDSAIADLAITSSRNTVADALIAAGISGAEAATILASVTDAASRDAALADIDVPEEPTDPTDPTDPVEAVTVSLNTKADNAQGTAANDTFYAFVQQNEAGTGAVANALATGDMIDGKGGHDILDATLLNDYTMGSADNDDIVGNTFNSVFAMPVVSNVEEIRVQAIENSNTAEFDSGATLDADRITGEDHYASDRSRGDLTITNVNLDADQITKDITIEMKNTQQNSDMAVYFNEQDLKAAPDVVSASAEFFIQVADGNAQDATKPLANIKFDLDFTQAGETYTFTNLTALDGTYAGLVATIEAALAEKGLTGYTVALGNEFTSFTTSNQTFNLDYTGNFVTVTDNDGVQFEEINFTPSQKSGTELAIILAQSDVDTDTQVISNKVESDVILDGVGRGSNGGELVIGSTSNSASSTGVQVINVTVENDSVVHDISTTNGALEKITLTNGDVKGDFVLTNMNYNTGFDGMYDNVDNVTNFVTELDNITATDFDGDIVLGRDSDIVNLGVLSANVAGDVTLNATYDGDTLASDKQAFVVVTGSGNDEITADVTGTSTSGSTDTSITISAGNGNNTVTLSSDATEVTVAKVTTGTGKDTVTGGETHLEVNTGAGNDVIYAENTGTKTTAELATASNFAATSNVVNTGATNYAIAHSELLHDREIQITVAMPEDANSIPAAAFTDGFELTTTVKASEGVLTTERDLYNAVADAINADDVVNKLVKASVDSNGKLTVDYLIDGATNAANAMVEIAVIANDYDDLSTTAKNALQAAIEEKFSDSDITATSIEAAYDDADAITDTVDVTVAGLDATTTGVNTVNGGANDDVIVLSSNDGTVDTLVMDGTNFGNDTIVHFNDATNGDILDFSNWLNNVEVDANSASTSTVSQVRIDGTLTAINAMTENSVSIIDFADIVDNDAALATPLNFDTMTTTQLLAEMNAAADFSASATSATLVGTKLQSILMIEDDSNTDAADDNEGFYKVYAVTYDTDAAVDEFTEAKLIGTLDFGDVLDVAGMDDTNIA